MYVNDFAQLCNVFLTKIQKNSVLLHFKSYHNSVIIKTERNKKYNVYKIVLVFD